MNYTDFREKIIIKGIDKKIGNKQKVCLIMYYEPHIGDSWTNGFIGEKSFELDELKSMDCLEPYKQVWSKLEPCIEQYYFHKVCN